MSNRTLIELNHDFRTEMHSPEFQTALYRYLGSADRESAEALERFGCRVISMRHHSDKYIIDAAADGFPPHYLRGRNPMSDEHDRIPARHLYEGSGGWKDGRFGQAYDLICEAMKERGVTEFRGKKLLIDIELEDGNHE